MPEHQRLQLLKILDDSSWGLDDTYSNSIKEIKKQVDMEIDDQQREESRNTDLMEKVNDLEN